MPVYKIVLRHSVNNLKIIQALKEKGVPIYNGVSADDRGPKWLTIEHDTSLINPMLIIRKHRSKPNYKIVSYKTLQQLLLIPNEAVLILFMEIAKN